MMTRWIVLGDALSCDERWLKNFVKGDEVGSMSVNSKVGRV